MSEKTITVKLEYHEIVKALEICTSNLQFCCKECPMFEKEFDNRHHCKMTLMRMALEIVKYQDAEIERFKEECSCLGCENEWLKAHYEQGKSEAVNEFAERFNTALSEFDLSSVGLPDYDRGYEDCITAVKDTFDNILKEMAGDNNGK